MTGRKKGARITEAQRAAIVGAYGLGASIRAIMAAQGLSYGAVHKVLDTTVGVTMRGRGGTKQATR